MCSSNRFYFSLLAIFLPRLTPRVFHPPSPFLPVAERKTLASSPFLIVIGVRLLFCPIAGTRSGIHDEYSYLCLVTRWPMAVSPIRPSYVDELRIVSRELVSDLFVEVSAGQGPSWRSVNYLTSMDRRALERCRDVRRDSLDVAGLASQGGTSRRSAGCAEIRNC